MDNRRPLTLLKQIKVDKVGHLNGDAIFFTRICTKCSQPFSVTFEHVVSKTRKFGFFKPYATCKDCNKPRRKKKLPNLNKSKKAKAKAKTINEKPAPKKPERKEGLVHRPFANLQQMLTKQEPAKEVELTPAQKAAITKKKNLEAISRWVEGKMEGRSVELPPKLMARAERALEKAQK
jgi:hypothetical protein